jgi:radical SAM superfamily enzyme YgiQ (UPF0313 family)
MRVLLISANTERINMPTPPLGAAMVAAAARSWGHDVTLVDLLHADDPERAVRDAIDRARPEVIGISVRNIDDQNMTRTDFLLDRVREVVDVCRASSTAPLVLGGAGYSIFPDAALDYLEADYGIAGEGETAFPMLLEVLEAGADPATVAGVHVRGGEPLRDRLPPADLDELPSPYPALRPWLDLEDPDLWVPIQTRRGCALDCTYCSTPAIEGRSLRWRSPERVADDVAQLADLGVRRLHFVDNTFNLPPTYALELCRHLADLGRDLRWRCIIYPHMVSDDLVAAMAEAGCAEVSVGSESGCDRILESLNKRFTAEEVRDVTRRFAAAGITTMGFLMLGVPGETRESVTESLDFATSLDLSSLKITVGARIYPDTPLARQAVEAGVIEADDDLLLPRFYLEPGVEDWIEEAVSARGWTMPVMR